MKFAKELEQDCVPEWRMKYLDYKTGKKLVKRVRQAVDRANGTPRPARISPAYSSRRNPNSPFFGTRNSPLARQNGVTDDEPPPNGPAHQDSDNRPESDSSGHSATPMLIPRRQRSKQRSDGSMQYGSFVPTPPEDPKQARFELPDPALKLGSEPDVLPKGRPHFASNPWRRADSIAAPENILSGGVRQNAYEVGQTTPPRRSTFAQIRHQANDEPNQPHQPHRMSTWRGPTGVDSRPLIRRLLSSGTPLSKGETQKSDFSLEAVDQVRTREKEFFKWLDGELDKVETFYKSKEDEAGRRLDLLREQLHEMRNRRISEIGEVNRARSIRKSDEHAALDAVRPHHEAQEPADPKNGRPLNSRDQIHAWIAPIERALDSAKNKALAPRPGPNTKALQEMHRSPVLASDVRHQHGRDYVRRPNHEHDVPYRTAKRKLKLALKEFYRGLELLKSYSLLNRTAFRKINKKYDKAVNARPPLRYTTEKVNKAWFVQSDVLDNYISLVEDLYARYFERGNHKIAVGKLRSSGGRPGEHDDSAFRSGLMVGTGAVFAIQGIVFGANLLLNDPDPIIQTQTAYLLQIYGGYFLGLYLFAWFCIVCRIWNMNKINYVFIFEFDPRNHIDWRQMAEFPAFLTLLLGLFIWLNFTQYGTPAMFLYYPVILIFVTLVVILLPAPILFHRSRRWFAYAHWRLLLAGLYPVEFRDFFLGDMYCSLTYLTANIEMFFCLYATYWGDPNQCNSTHSRLLGFFTTLPGIWRAFQCIRRYYDTRAPFPHLANCGKYIATILYYVTLSLYRIQETYNLLALFITFATLNAVYTSIWDLVMDWSLCQPHARKPFLRDVRGYKQAWYYYAAMVIDVIIRFNWIFYAIFTHNTQHSTVVSFLIALTEVSRRAMWMLFRVENEHCANVTHFKAARDVPLPYVLHEESVEPSPVLPAGEEETAEDAAQTTATSPALSRHRSRTTAAEEGEARPSPGTLRRRGTYTPRTPGTLTKMFAEAHTQDFEKRRRPTATDGESARSRSVAGGGDVDDQAHSSDEDEEDEQEAMDVRDAQNIMNLYRRDSEEEEGEE